MTGATPTASSELATRRVLFLGDSLVAGVGDPAGGGWVARVVAACFARGAELTPYNLGVRRETSEQVAARWRSEAAPRLARGVEARLVVSFGANDTTVEDGAVRLPAERSCVALASMLEQARALGLAQFVVGPAPVDDDEQNGRIGELSGRFADLCAERGVPFVGVLEPLLESSVWTSQVSAADGAHPQAAGYDEIARLLIDAGLATWLAAPADG